MKKTWMVLVLLAGVFLLPCRGVSEIYRWVDKDGVVTFRDSTPPPGVKAEVLKSENTFQGQRFLQGEMIDNGDVKRSNGAKQYPPVEIYMTKWCPACKTAINYLNSMGVNYIKYDIDVDRAAHERLSNQYHQKGIPFTIIGDVKISGFSSQRFDAALGIKK